MTKQQQLPTLPNFSFFDQKPPFLWGKYENVRSSQKIRILKFLTRKGQGWPVRSLKICLLVFGVFWSSDLPKNSLRAIENFMVYTWCFWKPTFLVSRKNTWYHVKIILTNYFSNNGRKKSSYIFKLFFLHESTFFQMCFKCKKFFKFLL